MDKSQLLKPRTATEKVDIPDVGTVVIRALSRQEILSIQHAEDLSPLEFEQKLLSMSMVDPQMNEADIAEWQRISLAGDMMGLLDAVNRISGITKTAAKESYKSL